MRELSVIAPADAGIAAVAGLKAELMAAFGEAAPGSRVLLDLSKTEKADSALAQLVIAARAEAAERKLELVVTGDDKERSVCALLSCDPGEALCSSRKAPAKKTAEARRER
jgi:hypothetical protein